MRKNFGGNIVLRPSESYQPRSEDEVLELLSKHSGRRFRCVGRLHSWSDTIQCDDILLDMRYLDGVSLLPTPELPVVRVGGGCQIKALLATLAKVGWTLPSVGFITEQSVAGAVATGTHGSGKHSLSHYVTSVRVAVIDGQTGAPVIIEINSDDALRAARCCLGSMGVVLTVEMQCREQYQIEEHFDEFQTLDEVLEAEKTYPQQQFYIPPWRWSYVCHLRREVDAATSRSSPLYLAYRHFCFDIAMHCLIIFAARILRSAMAVAVLFRFVLPRFILRRWRTVSVSTRQLVMEHELFRHIEIELFVQRGELSNALEFLRQSLEFVGRTTANPPEVFHEQVGAAGLTDEFEALRGTYFHHYPICVRKILPDDTLISMASNATGDAAADAKDRNETSLGDHWYSITLSNYHGVRQQKAFEDYTAVLAKAMARLFSARPHWGKLCPLEAKEMCALFGGMDRFCSQVACVDPHGVFRNAWVSALFECVQESNESTRMRLDGTE